MKYINIYYNYSLTGVELFFSPETYSYQKALSVPPTPVINLKPYVSYRKEVVE